MELISQELARVISHLQSDGSIYKINNGKNYRFTYCNNNKDLVLSFISDFRKEFGEDLRLQVRDTKFNTKNYFVKKCSMKIIKYFLIDKLHYKKDVIPSCIFTSDSDSVCAYLQAFFDDEGSFIERQIVACCKSKSYIEDVVRLLLTVGIKSNVREKPMRKFGTSEVIVGKKMYIVDISHRINIHRFRNKIGFLSKRKSNRLSIYTERTNKFSFIDEKKYESIFLLRGQGHTFPEITTILGERNYKTLHGLFMGYRKPFGVKRYNTLRGGI